MLLIGTPSISMGQLSMAMLNNQRVHYQSFFMEFPHFNPKGSKICIDKSDQMWTRAPHRTLNMFISLYVNVNHRGPSIWQKGTHTFCILVWHHAVRFKRQTWQSHILLRQTSCFSARVGVS